MRDDSSRGGILVLGSINMDFAIQGMRLPRPGQTVTGNSFRRGLGGKGANQAVAAARLTCSEVSLLAAIGRDAMGDEALAQLQSEPHLRTDRVMCADDSATGLALILVDAAGENMISVFPGANHRVTRKYVLEAAGSENGSASVFLACLEVPVDAVEAGLQASRKSGLLTILNPAPIGEPRSILPLLPQVDVLTPNESEAMSLSGRAIQSDTEVMDAGRALRDMGSGTVVITRGAAGCAVIGPEGAFHVPAGKVRVVDSTGAGDAFNGAIAVALSEGRTLPDAVQFATAAAAISVTHPGAQASLPHRAELNGRSHF